MLILASSHVASAFLAGTYGNARTAPVRMSVSGTVPEGTYSTVVFLRHGQSEWNEANLFTGWADVPLTTLGKNEAATGATAIWKEGIVFDVGYTSRLLRAKQTLEIVLQITGQEDLPVHRCWRLNERMYGALTGLNKKETVLKYGEDQVTQWRRSYDTPPPEIELDSPYAPHTDDKYCHIAEEDLPLSECLKDCVERTVPYWEGDITPALKRGKTVLVAAPSAAPSASASASASASPSPPPSPPRSPSPSPSPRSLRTVTRSAACSSISMASRTKRSPGSR